MYQHFNVTPNQELLFPRTKSSPYCVYLECVLRGNEIILLCSFDVKTAVAKAIAIFLPIVHQNKKPFP